MTTCNVAGLLCRPAMARPFPALAGLTLAFFLLLVLSPGIAYAAHARAKTMDMAQPPTLEAEQFARIGILLPSRCDDQSWSQALCETARAMQAEHPNLQFILRENMRDMKEAEKVLRELADQDMTLVIGHGTQFLPLLDEIAPQYPQTAFVYGGGDVIAQPNISAYDPRPQDGAYLMGMVAGIMTRSNAVGLVAPVDVNDAITYNRGFEEGVKASNPKAVVLITYTGTFDDLETSYKLARSHIEAGTDMLSGTSQQAMGALRAVAETPGVFWMANDFDMRDAAPERVLASQIYDYRNVLRRLLDMRHRGFKGGIVIPMSISHGNMRLEWSPLIPPEVRAIVDKTHKAILSGAFKPNIKVLRYTPYIGHR